MLFQSGSHFWLFSLDCYSKICKASDHHPYIIQLNSQERQHLFETTSIKIQKGKYISCNALCHYMSIHLPLLWYFSVCLILVCPPSDENVSCCYCEAGAYNESKACSQLSLPSNQSCGYIKDMPFYRFHCDPEPCIGGKEK